MAFLETGRPRAILASLFGMGQTEANAPVQPVATSGALSPRELMRRVQHGGFLELTEAEKLQKAQMNAVRAAIYAD